MPASRITTFLTLAAALATTAAVAAPSASAADLSLDGDTLVFRAAPGETNRLILSSDRPGELRFLDNVPITLLDGACGRSEYDATDVARCVFGGPVRVELGDGADRLSMFSDLAAGQVFTADGGPGDDELAAGGSGAPVRFAGGDGNDKLDGGTADDQLDGGDGNDELFGGFGNDTVRAGAGDDTLDGDGRATFADVLDGGPGIDTIVNEWTQEDRTGPISVTLDGRANDGHAGEGDDVTSVERITVNQPATLVAAGAAVEFKVFQTAPGPSRLVGSARPDTLISFDYADVIDGKGGDDLIEGGYGDDRIIGGPGRDTINAEAGSGSCNYLVCRRGVGNDTVDVRDGERDSVTCGSGTDVVRADQFDVVAEDCERVARAKVRRVAAR